MRRLASAVLVLPLAALTLAACDDDGQIKANASKACTTETAVATSAVSLPTGLLLSGIVFTGSTTQGSTTTYTGYESGKDPVAGRDAINAQLTSGGLTLGGQDQEKGVEAESDFSGAVKGHVRVRPLCTGYLQVVVSVSK